MHLCEEKKKPLKYQYWYQPKKISMVKDKTSLKFEFKSGTIRSKNK